MREIPLSQGKVALVDDEDASRVFAHKWTLLTINRKGKVIAWYARRNVAPLGWRGPQKIVLLHRFILNPPKGVQVDHINGDGLDNRRANLRLATSTENHCNTSKIRGDEWRRR